MRVRHVLLTTALVAAAVGAGGVTAASAGTSRGADSVPVPAPTHIPTSPCEQPGGPQQACDAAAELVGGAAYRCYAGSDLYAYADPLIVAATDGWIWEYRVAGFHGCPDRSGDIVRVTGTMEYEFDGIFDGPYTCGDWSSCETGNPYPTYSLWRPTPNSVVHVQTVSSTWEDAAATTTKADTYILP